MSDDFNGHGPRQTPPPTNKEQEMTHFAVRQTIGPSLPSDHVLELMATDSAAQPLAVYYKPGPGLLLSIYESENPPPALRPGQEVLPVIPITPEEYGPLDMEPAAGDGAGLQLVLVRRQLDPITHREFRALALQAIMCAHEYSDLLWVRSYWATGTNELMCVFRTREHDLVREHARRSRIPCDEVQDAVQIQVANGPVTAAV